jgi:hypothetical protein
LSGGGKKGGERRCWRLFGCKVWLGRELGDIWRDLFSNIVLSKRVLSGSKPRPFHVPYGPIPSPE